MRLRVIHVTRYTYPTPAQDSRNEVRLMPLSDSDQTCLDFRLNTLPPARIFAYDLPTGRVHHFNIREPHEELTITAESLVVTHRHDPFAGLQLASDDGAFYTREGVRRRYIEYLTPTERVPFYPELDRIAAVARRRAGANTASFLIALTRLLHRVFTYAPGAGSSPAHLLEQKQGICRDFAHLMLGVCRKQGIPARYISGYLFTGRRATPAEPLDGDLEQGRRPEEGRLLSGDAMHAWIECLLPDEGWHGFDPTNNLLANDAYIKVHYGRDCGDVPPVRGVFRGPAGHSLDVAVRVVADR